MNEKQLIENGIIEVRRNGEIFDKENGIIICPKNNGNGYLRIYIPKLKKKFLLHRVVAAAFIPNPEGKTQVNHIDGNKQNNNVDNLEWCTPKENSIHFFEKMGGNSVKVDTHSEKYRTGRKILNSRYLKTKQGVYGKVLKYCLENQLSIAAFEKKCNIGNGTIGRWEKGSKPSLDTLEKIEKETGITVSELVSN